jgi:uncharacterized protein YegP (UPF0339 family)
MATVQARKPYWRVLQSSQDNWWYIHLRGTNHKTVVWGGGYDTQENAKRAVQWVRDNAAGAAGP